MEGLGPGVRGGRGGADPGPRRLAAQGVRLPHAYAVNPVCTPSRSSLLTARYPHATGVTGNNRRLPEDEVAFAQVLAAAGYRTGYIGKWHLDGEGKPGFVPPGPRRHGFAYWAAFNRGHAYYSPVYYRDADRAITADAYEPDPQTDLALAFLEDPDPRPFCLVLAWGPPHTPLVPPPATAGQYRIEDMPLAPSVPAAEAARAREGRLASSAMRSAAARPRAGPSRRSTATCRNTRRPPGPAAATAALRSTAYRRGWSSAQGTTPQRAAHSRYSAARDPARRGSPAARSRPSVRSSSML